MPVVGFSKSFYERNGVVFHYHHGYRTCPCELEMGEPEKLRQIEGRVHFIVPTMHNAQSCADRDLASRVFYTNEPEPWNEHIQNSGRTEGKGSIYLLVRIYNHLLHFSENLRR